jgi:hypothetical protein
MKLNDAVCQIRQNILEDDAEYQQMIKNGFNSVFEGLYQVTSAIAPYTAFAIAEVNPIFGVNIDSIPEQDLELIVREAHRGCKVHQRKLDREFVDYKAKHTYNTLLVEVYLERFNELVAEINLNSDTCETSV